MTKTILKAKNLVKSYKLSKTNIVKALDGVSLEIKEGDFVAIMGPSGGGKSTLMHILGLLDKQDSGELEIDGVKTDTMSEKQRAQFRSRKLGFVFQGFNLIPTLSALENVSLAAKYAGADKEEQKKRAQKILKLVGLGKRMNHKPLELSGGQQQRVAIARALVNNPALILTDEPTGELDTKSSKEIMEIFKNLNEKNGKTVIIVTHNPEIAAQCKKTIRIRDGKIEN